MPASSPFGDYEMYFRTRDRLWIGLDRFVRETCALLTEWGHDIGAYAAKSTIVVARGLLSVAEQVEASELYQAISEALRESAVLMSPSHIEAVLHAYGRTYLDLHIVEVRRF